MVDAELAEEYRAALEADEDLDPDGTPEPSARELAERRSREEAFRAKAATDALDLRRRLDALKVRQQELRRSSPPGISELFGGGTTDEEGAAREASGGGGDALALTTQPSAGGATALSVPASGGRRRARRSDGRQTIMEFVEELVGDIDDNVFGIRGLEKASEALLPFDSAPAAESGGGGEGASVSVENALVPVAAAGGDGGWRATRDRLDLEDEFVNPADGCVGGVDASVRNKRRCLL